MKLDLLKTYDDLIMNDKTSQRQLDNCYNAIYMDYFVRPDLRINQRAGHKSNGDFVEGLHIYPDKECICEILRQIQDRINNSEQLIEQMKNNTLGTLLFVSDLLNYYIIKYFGSTEKASISDSVFYENNINSNEQMANLSDFKNKDCALCIERALASYIVLYVISNDINMKNYFPFKPFFSSINYSRNVTEKGGSYGHALCGLISQEKESKLYLFDPSNYGLVKNETGTKQYVYGLYELSEEEKILMFDGNGIEPTLFRCKHINGVTQLSHRAFSKNPKEFIRMENEYNHRGIQFDN